MAHALSHKSFLYAFLMPDNSILAKVKESGVFDEEYQGLYKLVLDGDVKTLDQGFLVTSGIGYVFLGIKT